ncbi:hypothetical protein SCLCIDRAFT_1211086 [Scleroderma citrinum Foug A]|uniref:Uncharacterized protein n=1 Tax=Scleroderma citrinum Foug A TaxID=1036808 RepID=A0A0C3AP12_9AGAM|nr:hypothetical protein SCLCIDRAFT_1211086 [Scleroderma citrinum Foug A]
MKKFGHHDEYDSRSSTLSTYPEHESLPIERDPRLEPHVNKLIPTGANLKLFLLPT